RSRHELHFHPLVAVRLDDGPEISLTEARIGQVFPQDDGIELTEECIHDFAPGNAVTSRGTSSPVRTIRAPQRIWLWRCRCGDRETAGSPGSLDSSAMARSAPGIFTSLTISSSLRTIKATAVVATPRCFVGDVCSTSLTHQRLSEQLRETSGDHEGAVAQNGLRVIGHAMSHLEDRGSSSLNTQMKHRSPVPWLQPATGSRSFLPARQCRLFQEGRWMFG